MAANGCDCTHDVYYSSVSTRPAPAAKPPASLISPLASEGDYYFFDMHPRQGPLSVVMGGRELCRRGYRVDRRGFRFWCLELVASGRGQLKLGGASFEIGPGSLFSYGPNIAHRIEASGDEPMVKYFVDFTGRRCRTLLAAAGLHRREPLLVVELAKMVSLFEDLQQHGRCGRAPGARRAGLQLELLLLQVSETAQPTSRNDTAARRTYQECRRAIEASALRWRSLDDVVQHCGISKPYLCRLFERFHGSSPYYFLTQLKMAHAAGMLARAPVRVKDVAEAVSFENPYHFSKVFRRVHRMSPLEFRRRAMAQASAAPAPMPQGDVTRVRCDRRGGSRWCAGGAPPRRSRRAAMNRSGSSGGGREGPAR